MTVTNSLEEVVPKTVARLVADHEHIRDCEPCTDDIVALTLSSLQPGYSSTDMGRILRRLDVDRATEHARITVAVLAAIDKVNQSPRHAE